MCDCDYILGRASIPGQRIAEHYDTCRTNGSDKKKSDDGSVSLSNPNLRSLDPDVLYHLGMDTKSYDLRNMFGDVKFVCMGGTKHRMRDFAKYIAQVLGIPECGDSLVNLTKHSQRYAMYKVGPVISVNHGIGISSMSVLLQEVMKLLHYSGAASPVIIRVGTSGGLGVPPGSVVISSFAVNGCLERCYELPILGKMRKLPAKFDTRFGQELRSMVSEDDGFAAYLGGTMAADDFYRGQARLDGPFCDYTKEEKMTFLRRLMEMGVRNIEMEATAFAAMTWEAGLRAADVCATFVDRLDTDQVTISKATSAEWQTRPFVLIGRYIKQYVDGKTRKN